MSQQTRWRFVCAWMFGLAVAGLVCGPPSFASAQTKRTYGLAVAPLEIQDRLSQLKMGDMPALTKEERQLLAKVWDLRSHKGDAKLDDATLLEAMLFASGITKAEARKGYR